MANTFMMRPGLQRPLAKSTALAVRAAASRGLVTEDSQTTKRVMVSNAGGWLHEEDA